MPAAKDRPAYAIASVDHALRLIRMLQTESPVRLADAARRLDVAPSTAHRLLTMLVYRDFAVQLQDKRYALAAAASLVSPQRGDGTRVGRLRDVAMPHMEALASTVEESVNLVVRQETSVFFIASVESSRILRVGAREGTTFPAHLASGGKALLAALSDKEVRQLYRRHTPRLDLDALLRELASTRTFGIAINHEATERGVVAVGRAVREGGEAVGAVSVSLPSVRFDPDALAVLSRALGETVQEIELALQATAGGDDLATSVGR